jgi:hypothetical protein
MAERKVSVLNMAGCRFKDQTLFDCGGSDLHIVNCVVNLLITVDCGVSDLGSVT